MYGQKPKHPLHGFAIASLVLGIVAMVLPVPVLGALIGVIGLVFAIVAKTKGHRGGMSTAGLVVSIIGTFMAISYTLTMLWLDNAISPFLSLWQTI